MNTSTQFQIRGRGAFSLMEALVSMMVLMMVVALIAFLFNNLQRITGLGHRQMDADSQAMAVLDRMSIDFGQMLRRTDVDYFLKDPTHLQAGNDQIAFFSLVPGYFPASGLASPLSLTGYRVNGNTGGFTYNKLERYGNGLVWNGDVSGNPSMAYLPVKIEDKWPNATTMVTDSHYELAGPQVFRMEYYYVLKGQVVNGATFDSILSDTPWDTRIQGISGVTDHTSVEGLRDVTAVGVVIAVIDPKTQVLVQKTALTKLAESLADFDKTKHATPGALEAEWQNTVISSGLPGVAISGIHIYRRWFHLSPCFSSTP